MSKIIHEEARKRTINYTVVKAKKPYKCVMTNKDIKIGEHYKRVNTRKYGVQHFHMSLDKYQIADYFAEFIMDRFDRENSIGSGDSFHDEIIRSLPLDY